MKSTEEDLNNELDMFLPRGHSCYNVQNKKNNNKKISNTDKSTHCPQGTRLNGFLYTQQSSKCAKNNLMRYVMPGLLTMMLCSLPTDSKMDRATGE